MTLLTPGYFPATYFVDNYWSIYYWVRSEYILVEEINLRSHINITKDDDSDIMISFNKESDIINIISKFSETDSSILISRYSIIDLERI